MLTWKEMRETGIALAEKEKLPKTRKKIERRSCFEGIMKTLVTEVGKDRAIALLAKANIRRWAYEFARHVPVDSKQSSRLIDIVVGGTGPFPY